MARPQKTGIDYFSLDCNLDEKFQFIDAQFGLIGFAVIIRLLQRIYGLEGYYCKWNNDVALLFSSSINQDKELVFKIVNEAIKREIFNKKIYNKYGVLTSSGIQKRYVEGTRKRKYSEIRKEYLLIELPKIKENGGRKKKKGGSKAEETKKKAEEVHKVNNTKENYSKENESKEYQTNIDDTESKIIDGVYIPSLEEVGTECEHQGFEFKGEEFYYYYDSQGWLKANGMRIHNWKSELKNWHMRRKTKEVQEALEKLEKGDEEDGSMFAGITER